MPHISHTHSLLLAKYILLHLYMTFYYANIYLVRIKILLAILHNSASHISEN